MDAQISPADIVTFMSKGVFDPSLSPLQIAYQAELITDDQVRTELIAAIPQLARRSYRETAIDGCPADHTRHPKILAYVLKHTKILTPEEIALIQFDGDTIDEFCRDITFEEIFQSVLGELSKEPSPASGYTCPGPDNCC